MSVESDSHEDMPEVPQGAKESDPDVDSGSSSANAGESSIEPHSSDDAEPTEVKAEASEDGLETSDRGEDAGEGEDDNDDDDDDDQLGEDIDVEPLELIQEEGGADEAIDKEWYILKVQVNREESIRAALERKVKIEGLERFFGDIVVPTEDIAEFTKTGKRRVVKKKLYPGYIMVNMAINDDTWFAVRETSGIGDFTGSAGRPAPMDPVDVERILKLGADEDEGDQQVKTAIPFNVGDRVRVKDGYFQNFEGDVEGVDEANGRVTVMINIFGRSTPVELEHWQIEAV